MATFIRDGSIIEALEQALTATTKTVVVNGRAVDVVKPFASPEDWRDHWIYFLMIDRFNNPAAPTGKPCRLTQASASFRAAPSGASARARLHKILGAGAIWITPPFQSNQRLNGASNEVTYHGYGFQHFLEIDPHFGTERELQRPGGRSPRARTLRRP